MFTFISDVRYTISHCDKTYAEIIDIALQGVENMIQRSEKINLTDQRN